MSTRRRRIAAFTLIELMIVVSVVSVLAAIAIPAYRRMTCRARQTEVKVTLRSTAEAMQAWQHEWDAEPLTSRKWFFVERDGCGDPSSDLTASANPGALPPYENGIGFEIRGKSHFHYRMCVTRKGNTSGADCDGVDYWVDAYNCDTWTGAPGAGEYWTMDSSTNAVVMLTPIDTCRSD